MTIDELREALGTYLAPLLSAQVLPNTSPCKSASPRVASLDPNRTAIKADHEGTERLVLYRKPGFTPEELALTKDLLKSSLQYMALLGRTTE